MSSKMSRRNFVKMGSLAVAGTSLRLQDKADSTTTVADQPGIRKFRKLGRTEFEASDISMGAGPLREPDVARYAYDLGINYFDTAEGYGNGRSESALGKALKFMDREKVFITTKLHIDDEDTAETILDRFNKCQNRLDTPYVDALYMHSVKSLPLLDHEGFHAAVNTLKAEGRLKHMGISSHGPRGEDGDSMEKVLCAAAEDGRFDLMLLVYNFMNKETGEKILAACKKNNVGTTAMKTRPGVIKVEQFDPENLTEEQDKYVQGRVERGSTRQKAIDRYQRWIDRQKEDQAKTIPYLEKFGVKTDEELAKVSVQWVLKNPDMHTICVGMKDFDTVERFISISGTKLSRMDSEFIRQFEYAYSNQYCRHGCTLCSAHCPQGLPVSTIMRYAYYFKCQGREKYAIQKYTQLHESSNAAVCETCDAPCLTVCPHGLDVQAHLTNAHSMLTLG